MASDRRETIGVPPLGLHTDRLAGALVFVLPNPSGRNAYYTYDRMLGAFRELKRYLDEHAAAASA